MVREYLLVTRAVDPVALERDRMATVSGGFRAPDKDLLHTIAHVSMQELATCVSHRGTGRLSDDPPLDRLLGRIATDENLHMVLYRDLVRAALDVDPTAMLRAGRRGRVLHDAGHRHPRVHPEGRGRRARRHIRPARPPRGGRHTAYGTRAVRDERWPSPETGQPN